MTIVFEACEATGGPVRMVFPGVQCAPGDVVVLRGESGAGKSTLLRTLTALGAGLVTKDGAPLDWPALCVVPQNARAALPSWWTVARVWAHHGVSARAAQGALATRFGLEPAVLKRRCHALSVGMAARVWLAAAVSARPAVLVADEPFAGLPEVQGRTLWASVRDLARTHGTVVLASAHAAWLTGDRTLCIDAGTVREVASVDAGDSNTPDWRAPHVPTTDGFPLAGLIRAGGFVLDASALRVRPGELAVLMAPSGAGKSTLAEHLAFGPTRAGFLPQHARPWFDPRLTVGATLRAAAAGQEETAVMAALNAAGASAAVLDALPGTLSGGEVARVALARVLLGMHAMLVADEPTAGLDETRAAHVAAALERAARGPRARAVLVLTHDPRFLSRADTAWHIAPGEGGEATAVVRAGAPGAS